MIKPSLEQLEAAPAGSRLINPSPLTPNAVKRDDGRWDVDGEVSPYHSFDLGSFPTDRLFPPALIRVVGRRDLWSWTCAVADCAVKFAILDHGDGSGQKLAHDSARWHMAAHAFLGRAS